MAFKDLSPKLSKKITSMEKEIALEPGVVDMGARMGGVSMYSDTFKRGYGDEVFGSSKDGIWLGAADFENAPFRVNMEGNMTISGENGASYLSPKVLIFYNNGVPEIVIGDPDEAP